MDNIDIDKLLDNIVPMEDLTELQVGHIVKGVIAGVFNEFSFVKVGPVSCILPVSEVSYNRKPKSPKAGTEIEAVVIRVSEEQGVMLSIKRTKPDPWESIDEMYHVGQRLDVTVKNIVDYGAFFEIEPGLEALLHRSEVGLTKKDKMKNYLSVGQELEVEIGTLDVGNKKISLRCEDFSSKLNTQIEGNEQ